MFNISINLKHYCYTIILCYNCDVFFSRINIVIFTFHLNYLLIHTKTTPNKKIDNCFTCIYSF